MIIDLILNRHDGIPYDSHRFYFDCLQYGKVGDGITRAMDYGTEADVKRELCKYIHTQGYSPDICRYVNSVKWLDGEGY